MKQKRKVKDLPCKKGLFSRTWIISLWMILWWIVSMTFIWFLGKSVDAAWGWNRNNIVAYTWVADKVEVVYWLSFINSGNFREDLYRIYESWSSLYITSGNISVNNKALQSNGILRTNEIGEGVKWHILWWDYNSLNSNNVTIIGWYQNKVNNWCNNSLLIWWSENELCTTQWNAVRQEGNWILLWWNNNKISITSNMIVWWNNNIIGNAKNGNILWWVGNRIQWDNVIVWWKNVNVESTVSNVFAFSHPENNNEFETLSSDAFYLNIEAWLWINANTNDGLSWVEVWWWVGFGEVDIDHHSCEESNRGVKWTWKWCLIWCTRNGWELLDSSEKCKKECENNPTNCKYTENKYEPESVSWSCAWELETNERMDYCGWQPGKYNDTIFEKVLLDSETSCPDQDSSLVNNQCVYKCKPGYHLIRNEINYSDNWLTPGNVWCYRDCTQDGKTIQHGQTGVWYKKNPVSCAYDPDEPRSPDTCGNYKATLICVDGTLYRAEEKERGYVYELKGNNGSDETNNESNETNNRSNWWNWYGSSTVNNWWNWYGSSTVNNWWNWYGSEEIKGNDENNKWEEGDDSGIRRPRITPNRPNRPTLPSADELINLRGRIRWWTTVQYGSITSVRMLWTSTPVSDTIWVPIEKDNDVHVYSWCILDGYVCDPSTYNLTAEQIRWENVSGRWKYPDTWVSNWKVGDRKIAEWTRWSYKMCIDYNWQSVTNNNEECAEAGPNPYNYQLIECKPWYSTWVSYPYECRKMCWSYKDWAKRTAYKDPSVYCPMPIPNPNKRCEPLEVTCTDGKWLDNNGNKNTTRYCSTNSYPGCYWYDVSHRKYNALSNSSYSSNTQYYSSCENNESTSDGDVEVCEGVTKYMFNGCPTNYTAYSVSLAWFSEVDICQENPECWDTHYSCVRWNLVENSTSEQWTSETGITYKWKCEWEYGLWTPKECVETKDPDPITWACGTSLNWCDTWIWEDVEDSDTQYQWICRWRNWWEDSSICTSPIPPKPITGDCGVSLNECAAWNFKDLADTDTEYRWICEWINGWPNSDTCTLQIPSYTCWWNKPTWWVDMWPETYANASYTPNNWADGYRTYKVSVNNLQPCEWQCKGWYVKSGNWCIPEPKCTWNTFANARQINWIWNATSDVTNTLYNTESEAQSHNCSYVCNSWCTKNGNECICSCKNTLTVNPNGWKVTVNGSTYTSSTDITWSCNSTGTLTLQKDNTTNTSNCTVNFNWNGWTPTESSKNATITKTTKYSGSWTDSDTCGTMNGNTYTFPSSNGTKCTKTAKWATGNVNTSTWSITLPNASRTGSGFSGWYTAPNGGTRVWWAWDSYTPSSCGVTLYAQWSNSCDRDFTVTYDKNGWTWVSKTTASVHRNNAVDLTQTGYPQNGYKFIWWNTNKNATTALGNYSMPCQNVTLYAIYETVACIQQPAHSHLDFLGNINANTPGTLKPYEYNAKDPDKCIYKCDYEDFYYYKGNKCVKVSTMCGDTKFTCGEPVLVPWDFYTGDTKYTWNCYMHNTGTNVKEYCELEKWQCCALTLIPTHSKPITWKLSENVVTTATKTALCEPIQQIEGNGLNGNGLNNTEFIDFNDYYMDQYWNTSSSPCWYKKHCKQNFVWNAIQIQCWPLVETFCATETTTTTELVIWFECNEWYILSWCNCVETKKPNKCNASWACPQSDIGSVCYSYNWCNAVTSMCTETWWDKTPWSSATRYCGGWGGWWGGWGCFLAWTPVLTSEWFKNIEDIQIWDMVLTYDTIKMHTEYNKITDLLVHEDNYDELYELTIDGNLLQVTSGHPFFVINNDTDNYQCKRQLKWLYAKELKVWYELLMSDGNHATIQKITHKPNHWTVYNLAVENQHNYFVGEWYLVHNANTALSNTSSMKMVRDDGVGGDGWCGIIVNAFQNENWMLCGSRDTCSGWFSTMWC